MAARMNSSRAPERPRSRMRHPDYQRGASEAVSNSARQKRDRYSKTEREQTPPNLVKIADKR